MAERHSLPTVAFIVALTGAMFSGIGPSTAQGIGTIRDAEIENTIRNFSTPVFLAANLDPSAVKIHLVKDKTLNAFVAGGQRLFINTGMLTQAKSAEQIIGVIAHETGHISGGHLARIKDALKGSTATTILSIILGGAAIGAGRGDIGSVIIAGGQGVIMRNYLSYTRTQESAADQAALKYLDKIKISAKGFLEFMELLGDQELQAPERQDPYVRTHPLTRNRVAAIAYHVANSPYSDNTVSSEFDIGFRRLRAKLYGFLNPIGHTLRVYKESDNSLESRYARAVGYYRVPNLKKAVPLIDGLIAEYPKDPYFRELKGQMLFENGKPEAALVSYQNAVTLLPDNSLIRRELARVQLALNDPALLKPAIKNLRIAIADDSESPFTWRQLAIAYGRQGDKGHSSLALAEEALLTGEKSAALYHAGLAERLFPHGSREWLQSQDILLAARQKKKR